MNICKISSKLSNPFDSIGKDPLALGLSAFHISFCVFQLGKNHETSSQREKRQGQTIETREKARICECLRSTLASISFSPLAWDGILGNQFNEILESFAPSLLLADLKKNILFSDFKNPYKKSAKQETSSTFVNSISLNGKIRVKKQTKTRELEPEKTRELESEKTQLMQLTVKQ